MSEELVLKKGRGRPVGSIREVYFVMSAIVSGELVMEDIHVTRGDGISVDAMLLEAEEIFVERFKMKPQKTKGPCFDAKLAQTTGPKKESIKMAVEEINYTKRKASAQYNNWEVVARYIEDIDGTEHQEVVHVFYIKEIEIVGGKPRAKPQPVLKKISELTNIVELN